MAAPYFLLFMYMAQLYKEDWIILHMLGCWDIALPSTEQIVWIMLPLKLIDVIKMVQHVFSFPGLLAIFRVWMKSMVLQLFQHTYLPISMWKPTIFHGDAWFESCTFFFT